MATKAEVRDRAATELGRLRLGQALQYQDQVRIESAYDEVYADLKSEGLTIWPSDGDVPTAVVPHVAMLMAYNCANTYGISGERLNRIALMASTAMLEIRRLVTPAYESLENPTDY